MGLAEIKKQEIFFKNIELMCNIGVYKHEKEKPQRVIVNIKILLSDTVNPKNDKIIAVHIIGAHAGELIGEAATALEAGLSAEDIALICHAHPTLSESMKEAASLASIGKTLHF